MKSLRLIVFLGFYLVAGSAGQASPLPTNASIARIWDEAILSAIRIDKPNPPVHARNLFHLSAAMYDAWAAYDGVAVGYLYHQKHIAPDIAAARREAISYAAYRLLTNRYRLSVNSTSTLPALTAVMTSLGYNPDNQSRDRSTPAGVGNTILDVVTNYFFEDGAREGQAYNDWPLPRGYEAVNSFLSVATNGTGPLRDVNHWQPLSIPNAVSQNGLPLPSRQTFAGAQWLAVRPFALQRDDPSLPWIDPGPPPHLGGVGDAEFRSNNVVVIQRSSELTPDDGVMIDISPGAFGNNTLGANDGTGHPLNPATGQPYASKLVKRGDFARVLAQWWADGPDSETPPGHWNVIANRASDSPGFVKRVGGTGQVLDDLEWDVKVYFALNAAVHDAACAAWSLKRYYDGWRPITAIRFMGQNGQSTDPSAASYHTNGLPLIPGLIELVSADSAQLGGRHAGLTVGHIALHAWPGVPQDTNQYSGVRWIDAAAWVPYQWKGFVTPAFPGYPSGHSTFSRAAAEVLTAMTGSPFFPGGLAADSIARLPFEQAPAQPVALQWATYYDAADQAGLSRIWGGIHPPVDDFTGRRVGAECGRGVWALVQKYFDGSVLQTPVALSIRPLAPMGCEVRYNTLRGLAYRLQSTTDMNLPFLDEPIGSTAQALDSSLALDDNTVGRAKFYRVMRILGP